MNEDNGNSKSKEILENLFRKKKYNEAYDAYKTLFEQYPKQKDNRNLNNILVTIYKLVKDKNKFSLIEDFMMFLKEYLNCAKNDKNLDTWAENILLNLFNYSIDIKIIEMCEHINNSPHFKNLISKFISEFVDIFSEVFGNTIFMQSFVAFIFKERTNFERKENSKITKLLAEVYLDYTENKKDLNKSRSTIYNLLSDLQVTSLSGASFDDNYKKAIEYLSKSLKEFENIYAKKRKEELEKVALSHEQIRKFRHDTTSTISGIRESITSLIDNDNKTKDMLIDELKHFRNAINDITGHFNLIQQKKADLSKKYNIETFLKHTISDYNFINEFDVLIKNAELAEEVAFDGNYMTAIIRNFIKNSREAYQKNGLQIPKTAICISFDFKSFELSYEDFAGGIKNEEMLEKIFEPYVSTKGTQNNIGMGLAIVKTAVDMHKWNIKAKNTKNGLKFIIKLNKMEEF